MIVESHFMGVLHLHVSKRCIAVIAGIEDEQLMENIISNKTCITNTNVAETSCQYIGPTGSFKTSYVSITIVSL